MVNPYQPPGIETLRLDAAFDGDVFFSGVATLGCYRRLMPSSFLSKLIYLLCAVISPIWFVFIAAGLFSLMFDHSGVTAILSALGLVCLSSVCLVCMWFLAFPLSRARRALRRFPDLLDPFSGRLTDSGGVVSSQGRDYWLHPNAIASSILSTQGLRLVLSTDEARFLPIAKHCFLDFDQTRLLQIVKSNLAFYESLQTFSDWRKAATEFLGTEACDGLWYGGPIVLRRKYSLIEFVGILAIGFCMLFLLPMFGLGTFDIAILLVVSLAAFLIAPMVLPQLDHWRLLRQGVSVSGFYWGSISSSDWIIGDQFLAYALHGSDISKIEFAADHVAVYLRIGGCHTIFKTHLESGDERRWLELTAFCEQRVFGSSREQ